MNEIKVGDTVEIVMYSFLCYAFYEKEQKKFAPGTMHEVTGFYGKNPILGGDTRFSWRPDEIRRIKV